MTPSREELVKLEDIIKSLEIIVRRNAPKDDPGYMGCWIGLCDHVNDMKSRLTAERQAERDDEKVFEHWQATAYAGGLGGAYHSSKRAWLAACAYKNQSRNQVLEEAAKVCERYFAQSGAYVSVEIRSLKSKPEVPRGDHYSMYEPKELRNPGCLGMTDSCDPPKPPSEAD